MRARAKCKLCGDIIVSQSRHDYVTCSCGEISVDGGTDYFKTSYKTSRDNFVCVDDEGNEIVPTYKADAPKTPLEAPPPPSREDKIDMLDEMIKAIERLPEHAMHTPVTHADYVSLLMLLSSILKH